MLTKQEYRLKQMQVTLDMIAFHNRQIEQLQGKYKALLWEALNEAEMSEKQQA
jgi:hypothetical protein